jgi:hypothetical protein
MLWHLLRFLNLAGSEKALGKTWCYCTTKAFFLPEKALGKMRFAQSLFIISAELKKKRKRIGRFCLPNANLPQIIYVKVAF